MKVILATYSRLSEMDYELQYKILFYDKNLLDRQVFGVLFSGVTGIMAGANLSGELVNPGSSIPRGTLAACAFTLCVFLLMSLLTSMTSNPELLLHDCLYLQTFSLWGPVVTVGVVLATLSASLNNLIGASR